MTTMAARPTLQQMVKQAMADGARRVGITAEASRQMENLGEKTAEEQCKKCDKAPCACKEQAKEGSVPTDYALKFASALEYGIEVLQKQATVEPGKGPGALAVSQSTAEGPISDNMGQATPAKVVPMSTGLQSARGEAPTQVPNDEKRAPGGSAKMAAPLDLILSMAKSAADKEKDSNFPALAALKGKVISAPRPNVKSLIAPTAAPRPMAAAAKMAGAPDNLVDFLIAQSKEAEDAINPARISAGAAVPPETSAAEEPGGQPVGGAPQGPTQLIGSNESAINFTKGQAYANRKADMGKYVNEPMMSAAHDKTLANAFSHTGEAGTKISSASVDPTEQMKVAAGRALLQRLVDQAKTNPVNQDV